MNVLSTLPAAARAACALALLAAAAVSEAQAPSRSVRAVPQPAAPAISSLPSPSGLASPLPNPAGLTSQFPAGLPSPILPLERQGPLGELVPPPAFTGRAAGAPSGPYGIPQTSVLGGAGYGVPAGRASFGAGSGPFTALQIAQSFLGADANRDGELTRGEAQRLLIMPYSFEEMDRNHDGVLTRFEYEDGVR